MTDDVEIDRPVLRWGNSFAIRLTQADLERLGVDPGQRVKGRLRSDAVDNKLDQVRFLKLGLPSTVEAIDRLITEDVQSE